MADNEINSVCGLQPRDGVSDATAIVMLYHNRCVSTNYNIKTRRWKYFEEKTRVLARADS